MVVDPAPMDLAHWLSREMKNKKKHAQCMSSRLMLSIIVKMKIEESGGLGLNAEPNSDLGGSELWPLASKQQIVPLRPWTNKKVVNVGGRQNQETLKPGDTL